MGKFIDVSEFNSVDWAKAKSSVSYVYLRCGLRGSLAKTAPKDYKKIRFDKKWKENLNGVLKNNIPFGAYYFPTSITDAEALEGAKWFYEQIKDLKMSLPPMLDSENVWGTGHEAGRANGLSKAERTRLLKIVTDYFNARGINIGIYASASWLSSKIDMSAFPKCVIDCTWVADSTGAVDYSGYYWLHQYGQETVTGCGKVDVNKVMGKIPLVKIGKTEEKMDSPVDVTIEIAESQEGYKEGSNNHTKYGDEMHALQPRNMDKNAPWCDCFVDWCIYKMCQRFGYGAETARKVLCGDFDDYTYNSVALYKKAGRWTQKAARGYQIFFGGSGHTGLVEKVSGGRVYTIEGNKSNRVTKCSYSVGYSSIIGYGMPRYDLVTGTAQNDGVLRKGCQGKAVRFLQLCLGGLNDDGDFGWKTLNKVLEFQRAHGLADDGEVGEKTWAAIRKTLPTIQRGSQGRYVEALQVALGGLTVDGDFGTNTYKAVTAFQREQGLASDGEVGQKTWGAVISDVV